MAGDEPLVRTEGAEARASASSAAASSSPAYRKLGTTDALTDDDALDPEDSFGNRDASLRLTPGAYTAILAATFGKVFVTVKGAQVLVHPFLLLVLSWPCFIAQLSAIFALQTALEKNNRIEDVTVQEIKSGDVWEKPVVRLQLLMIGLFYVMNFQTLLRCSKQMFFLLNPMTWIEVSRPSQRRWAGARSQHWLWRAAFSHHIMCFCSVVGVIMRFTIGYLVCADSVSVMLGSKDAEECIFNALAITFIADLDVFWWQCCQLLFHIPEDSTDSPFVLLKKDKVWDKERPDQLIVKVSPAMTKLVRLTTPKDCWARATDVLESLEGPATPVRKTVLARNHGFKEIEHGLALVVMWGIYVRQIAIVLFSIDTRILPVTRDVCMQFRLHQGHYESIVGHWGSHVIMAVQHAFESMMPIPISEIFANLSATHRAHMTNCSDEEYKQMTLRDAMGVVRKYHEPFILFTCVLVSLFFLPHLVISLHYRFFPQVQKGTTDMIQSETEFIESDPEDELMRDQLKRLEAKVKLQEKRLHKLESSGSAK